ncbi:hypothetical protein [Candidatus Palauibacter sp.]|uniref:hypothetical protein n=1 Tax=Candidatus Palauibacter sp. TaxID=3101350 RepID=UPI003B5C383D
MPELDGQLWIVLVAIFLWGRWISAAMKRNRQRHEAALEASNAEAEGGAAPQALETQAPSRARRPGFREQLADMGRQMEQQMAQAAEEGRPGSLVAHRDPEEAPPPPGFIRPASRRAPDGGSPPPERQLRPAATVRRPEVGARRLPPPATVRGRVGPGAGPLDRLDRYPALARAVILSEILGPPPGLPRERQN